MTIIGLIIAVVATMVIVWLTDRAARQRPSGTAYPQWTWVVYAVLIIIWLIGLAYLFGIVGSLNTPIGVDAD